MRAPTNAWKLEEAERGVRRAQKGKDLASEIYWRRRRDFLRERVAAAGPDVREASLDLFDAWCARNGMGVAS